MKITEDRLEIFKQIFHKKMDYLDSSTHLNKLFELLPALIGLPSNKNSGYNKANSHKQHEEELLEARDEKEAMDQEFEKLDEPSAQEEEGSLDQMDADEASS